MPYRKLVCLTVVFSFATLLSACETTNSPRQTSTSDAENRLGYVRSKDTSTEFKKFEYQFSMDMDMQATFKPIDREEFNKCKIYASDRVPVETMLDSCTSVIDSPSLPKKMKTASLYNRGLIYQNLERETEARSDFETVLDHDNNFGDAELALAGLEMSSERYVKAAERIELALAKKLQHPEYAHYLLGHALEKQNKFVEARDEYRRALVLRPNWRDVQRRIDRIGISWPE